MKNNILKPVCSKNRFVSSANITGSTTEEMGRSLTYNKKGNGPVLSPVELPKKCSECLFYDYDITKYTVFCWLGSYVTRQD